jgi:hypothetical protein
MEDLPYILFTNDKNQQIIQPLNKSCSFQIIKFSKNINYDHYQQTSKNRWLAISGYRIIFQLEDRVADLTEHQLQISPLPENYLKCHIEKNKSYFKRYKI